MGTWYVPERYRVVPVMGVGVGGVRVFRVVDRRIRVRGESGWDGCRTGSGGLGYRVTEAVDWSGVSMS